MNDTSTTLLLIGTIFLLTGLITKRFPPKKINSFYGYRTPKSKSNVTNWKISQIESSKRMIEAALVLMCCSVIFYFIPMKESTSIITIAILIIASILYILISVERKLK